MDDNVIQALTAHAAADYPRECCGLVVSIGGALRYWPCRNTAGDTAHFAIHAEDYAAAEDAGEIVFVCHSHPNASPEPSDADRAMCELTGLPWLIVNWPLGTVRQFGPTGWQAPLVGRSFVHGVFDCWSLIRDYYARELATPLPDFARDERWWDQGGDLYRQHLPEAGFAQVQTSALRAHDLLLMRVNANVPNHAAVYLGENRLLHHLMGRLSERTIYGGWYRRMTTAVWRHKSLQ